MNFAPNVFFIGAMKAGTTTLAELLSQHPDICLPKPMEPHFFTEKGGTDINWYKSLYLHPKRKICIDDSTSYSIAPIRTNINFTRICDRYKHVPEKIMAYNPNAKFIYILRDPVARTYSHYNHNARSGWERRPFLQAIHEDAQYLSASHYLQQLENYWGFFPKDRFLLLKFEELVKAPRSIAQQCFDFLDVDPHAEVEISSAKNAGFLYNPIGKRLNNLGIMEFASRVIPKYLKKKLAPLVSKPIPPISPSDKMELAVYFRQPNLDLEAATGFDISDWT